MLEIEPAFSKLTFPLSVMDVARLVMLSRNDPHALPASQKYKHLAGTGQRAASPYHG